MAPSLARAVDEGGLGEIPSRRHQKDCEANEWETGQGGAVGCVREEERLEGGEGEKRGWYTVLIPKSGCVVPESTWPVDRLRLFQCFLDLAPSNQSRRKKGNLPRVGSWGTVCDQYPPPIEPLGLKRRAVTGRSLGVRHTYGYVPRWKQASRPGCVSIHTTETDSPPLVASAALRSDLDSAPPVRRDMPRTEALAAHPQLKLSDQHRDNGVRGYPDRHQSMRKREAEI